MIVCCQRSEAQPCLRAISDFGEVIRLQPIARNYLSRAKIWEQMGNWNSALADYNAAVELDRGSDAIHQRALARSAQGDFVGAITDFTEAIRHKPSAASFSERGFVQLFKSGNYDAAIADFTEAIRFAPAAMFFSFRARARLNQGDLASALADADEAIAKEGIIGNPHKVRADTLIKLGRRDEAVSAYRSALNASISPQVKSDIRNLLRQLGIDEQSGE